MVQIIKDILVSLTLVTGLLGTGVIVEKTQPLDKWRKETKEKVEEVKKSLEDGTWESDMVKWVKRREGRSEWLCGR